MLKLEDFVREFPVDKKTDRDCESVILIEWLKAHGPFKSVLDIGCHSSLDEGGYAQTVRELTKLYDGIDIEYDNRMEGFLNHYFIGNANTQSLNQYEAVLCVSTIEHAGLSTYKGSNEEEKSKLFETALGLASKYLWISFPVGQPYVYPDQLSIITEKQLRRFETLTSNFQVKQRFFYNQGPQAGHPWYEHTKRDVALKIPYIDYVGNASICVMEIEK